MSNVSQFWENAKMLNQLESLLLWQRWELWNCVFSFHVCSNFESSSADEKPRKRSSATWSDVTSDGWFVHSCEVWFVRRCGIWFVHWFEVWFAHWRALPFRPQSDPGQRLLTCCATKLAVPRWYWSRHRFHIWQSSFCKPYDIQLITVVGAWVHMS